MDQNLLLPKPTNTEPTTGVANNVVSNDVGSTTQQTSIPTSSKNNNSTNPAYANEDDVIEKEWVDRAKKILATTKGDPFMQASEVMKLQADYLKKRYGKELKTS